MLTSVVSTGSLTPITLYPLLNRFKITHDKVKGTHNKITRGSEKRQIRIQLNKEQSTLSHSHIMIERCHASPGTT